MKPRKVLASMAIALVLGALLCAQALAAGPQQITFTITGPSDGTGNTAGRCNTPASVRV